ncbi:class C beta-lactamase-related serine hydrolase [Harryflintia acetispora]|nr:class C beta-lactamase-related serine hydrolase [Harryflintia acetispora]
MKRTISLLFAACLILAACAVQGPAQAPREAVSAASEVSIASGQPEPESDPEPEPEADNSWQLDAPQSHGMDPALFEQLHAALAGSQIYAMVTAKDGVLIDEYYQEGYDESSVFALHSCSKSFTGALVGIAIEQGYFGGVDDLLSDYLPQVDSLEEGKRQLTLRHLLTHTSGLEWYEWGGGYSNWREFQSAENWVEYILGRSLVAQPGTLFNYSTGNTHLLSAALTAATGMDELQYAEENLFGPLGMESVEWGRDPQGICDGGNGISMSARDAARFGQLYLQGGSWQGQQLVPANWVEASTSVQNPGPGGRTGQYGYQWWINSFGAKNYDTYFAFGAWGQYIFVVPELDLVTVITSNYPSDSYAPWPYFTDYVLAAYQEGA